MKQSFNYTDSTGKPLSLYDVVICKTMTKSGEYAKLIGTVVKFLPYNHVKVSTDGGKYTVHTYDVRLM